MTGSWGGRISTVHVKGVTSKDQAGLGKEIPPQSPD